MKKMKVLDYNTLVALNESSIRTGRGQNLSAERMPKTRLERYHINLHTLREVGRAEVRMCIVLDYSGRTAWLDVSPEEYAAIPEVEMSDDEWELAMCAGSPPLAP